VIHGGVLQGLIEHTLITRTDENPITAGNDAAADESLQWCALISIVPDRAGLFAGWTSPAFAHSPLAECASTSPGSNAGSLLEAYGPGEVASLLMETPERLLTPGEVAEMFRVDPKTVTRWAAAGRIGSIRTPGGHRRFRESEVNQLLVELTEDPSRFTA